MNPCNRLWLIVCGHCGGDLTGHEALRIPQCCRCERKGGKKGTTRIGGVTVDDRETTRGRWDVYEFSRDASFCVDGDAVEVPILPASCVQAMPDAAEESGVYGSEEMVDVRSLQIQTGEGGESFRGMYGGNWEAKPRVKIGRISGQRPWRRQESRRVGAWEGVEWSSPKTGSGPWRLL